MKPKIRLDELVVLIRGAGEMATGVAHRLHRSHFKICMVELSHPLAVRREVSFCEAIYDGEKEVEGVRTKYVSRSEEVPSVWKEEKIPLLVDHSEQDFEVVAGPGRGVQGQIALVI